MWIECEGDCHGRLEEGFLDALVEVLETGDLTLGVAEDACVVSDDEGLVEVPKSILCLDGELKEYTEDLDEVGTFVDCDGSE